MDYFFFSFLDGLLSSLETAIHKALSKYLDFPKVFKIFSM